MCLALVQELAKHKPQGHVIAPSELTAWLRKYITDPDVQINTRRSANVDLGCAIVGGLYDSESEKEDLPCIEIYIAYHPDQQHLELSTFDWGRLCFDVAECIGHEQVHKDQQHRRKKKTFKQYASKETAKEKHNEQEYLGSTDEIEAYGFTIAAELAVKHNVFEVDDALLAQVFMWQVYTKTFDTDQSVLLKLRKQISKYLRRLEVDYNDKTNRPRRNTRARRTRSV